MTHEAVAALAVFAFVSSITPGPNNLMLMASGASFGFQRSVPHMLGIGIGFVVMVVLVGLGLASLFERFPAAHLLLKTVSVAYLLYLAWKIATAVPAPGKTHTGQPMTFLQAAAFQWVNPKAWTMALTAVTVYSPAHDLMTVAKVALLFGAVNLPAVSSWTLLGQALARFLTNPAQLRAFNWTMAALLLASLSSVLWP